MKRREVLFALLLIGVAVLSGLVGLAIGRNGGAHGRQLMQEAISGEDIGFRGSGPQAVRFYNGPRIAATYEYWLEPNEPGDRYLVSCCNRRSPVIFSVYYTDRGEARVNNGPTIASPTVYFLDGGTAYEGGNDKGPAAWSRCGGGDDICVGRGEQGRRVYHIERGRIFEGANVQGEIIMTSDNENLEDDSILSLLVPILVERLWEQW
jgi:hypothetical protein